MARVDLALTLDGELLAYCAMKAALEEIRDMREAKPWEADLGKAADIAVAALECEERLGGT